MTHLRVLTHSEGDIGKLRYSYQPHLGQAKVYRTH